MKTKASVSPELIRLDIEKLDSQGDGISRDATGKIIFVPGVLPGETVLARKTTEKKDFATARLVEIEKNNPDRVKPFCPWYERCGGCQIQHASYPLQLKLKGQLLEDAFSRIGRMLPLEGFSSVAASPLESGYRNKISLPVSRSENSGNLEIGYFQKRSHRVVAIDRCPVAMPVLNEILKEVRAGIAQAGLLPYDERTRQGLLRHVVLRGGQETGEILIILVVHHSPDPAITKNIICLARRIRKRYPQLVGLSLNYNPAEGNVIFGPVTKALSGRAFFYERLADLTFKFDATSFAQVNTRQAVRLYQAVADEACPSIGENVLELYAGVGTLTCFLAARSSRVVALEEWGPSVDCLKENVSRNSFTNVRALGGSAEKLDFSAVGPIDSVVLDPPRSGCHPDVLNSISRMSPRRVIYVSCNPSTLARDVGLMCREEHFHLRKVLPFDLFPQTCHVESIAVLDRGSSS
jgi:23S rRNA (uracil1939-C5)-methyltransferase